MTETAADHFFPVGLPTSPGDIDPEVLPYWEAAENGQLVLPYCVVCDQYFWYPRGFCPRCGGADLEWRRATGHGAVYSYAIVRKAFGEWAAHSPFVVAYVTLDEGVTLTSNLIGLTEEDLRVGMEVRAVFEQNATEDAPALRFTALA